MALIGLKQLDSPLTGSLKVSGSGEVTGSLIVSSSNLTIDNSGGVSGSSVSTGSFGSLIVGERIQGSNTGGGNLKIGKGIIYSDGNQRLGIGDSVPAAPDSEIHIKAASPEITLQRTSNSNDNVIDFQNASGAVTAKIVHTNDGDANNSIVFHTYNGSTTKERLKITGGSATTKISGSSVSTGSFGVINVGGGHFTSASLAAGGAGGGGIFEDVGTSKTTTNNLQISGSLIVSGSTFTVRTGTDSGPPTASTAIYTNNITNGYPFCY